MKISLDISPAAHAKAGLGRYAHSLAKALQREHSADVHLFANLTAGAEIPKDLELLPRTTVEAGYKLWRTAILLGQLSTLRFDRLLPKGVSLFHATEHLLLPTRRIPTVLTIHDLIFKLFPEYHKRLNYWYLNLAMPLFAKRATHIIAVSEATRRDIITHYKVPPEKITVIYEAAAPHFVPQPKDKIETVKQKYQLPEHYLVTVGTIEPRKNLARLVEALARLRQIYPDLHLVVVGGEGWLTEYFYDAIKQFDVQPYVVRPGFIPDADLPAVIAGAACSVTPSLYEGFGLPVLEAMACGTPIVCSDRASLPEIAGEAALTFDPENVGAMVAQIDLLLSNPAQAAAQRERGFLRAQEFSWARTAQKTWAVYQEVLQQDTSAGDLTGQGAQ